jgi:hypothetical protein
VADLDCRRGDVVKWEIIRDQCPVPGPNGEECQGRQDGEHAPIDIPGLGNGDHWCTDWADGEIVGIFTWSAP